MFLKRVEVEKKFNTLEEARAFTEGITFVGSRDFKVKEIREEALQVVVVLEKVEKSKI